MTKKEFALLAMAIKTYYPKEGLLPNEQAMELWYKQLQDIEYNVAEMALNKWVATNKWSPSIADIREMAAVVTGGDIQDWGEGWEKVLNAIRSFGFYRQAEAMQSLDELTRTCVERIGFVNLCMSDNIVAERANFRMIYEQLANRKKQDAQLPEGLKKAIAQCQYIAIEGGKANE